MEARHRRTQSSGGPDAAALSSLEAAVRELCRELRRSNKPW